MFFQDELGECLLSLPTAKAFSPIALDGSVTQFTGTTGAFQSFSDPAGNNVAVEIGPGRPRSRRLRACETIGLGGHCGASEIAT